MTLNEKQFEFTYMVGRLIVYGVEVLGLTFRQDECWRSRARQIRLKATGKSKTLNSKHLNSLATDLVFFRDGKPIWNSADPDLLAMGEFWEALGGTWGGRWGWDGGHFEYGKGN